MFIAGIYETPMSSRVISINDPKFNYNWEFFLGREGKRGMEHWDRDIPN